MPKKSPAPLPSVRQITRRATLLLWTHRRLFAGITLTYGLLNLVLVQGVGSGTDVSTLKDSFSQAFTGNFSFIPASLGTFAVLVGTAGNASSQTAGAYQLFLAIITSLAIIWSLRQVVAGSTPRIRDAFYRGMAPLVPFILVLLVVGLQLLPLAIGSGLYSLALNNGVAVFAYEKILWALGCAGLALWSLYMVSSSSFALYIATLPDMTPLKALRSARELVRGRRWTVLRKLVCLPVILLVTAAVIMLPIIVLLTPLAQWVFFLLTMFSLAAIHAYMYTMYRELLDE